MSVVLALAALSQAGLVAGMAWTHFRAVARPVPSVVANHRAWQ